MKNFEFFELYKSYSFKVSREQIKSVGDGWYDLYLNYLLDLKDTRPKVLEKYIKKQYR